MKKVLMMACILGAMGSGRELQGSEPKREADAFSKYEQDVKALIKTAENKFKTNKDDAYRAYEEIRNKIGQAINEGKVSFQHKEQLKAMVLRSINGLSKDRGDIDSLIIWFTPTTKEELEKSKQFSVDDLLRSLKKKR